MAPPRLSNHSSGFVATSLVLAPERVASIASFAASRCTVVVRFRGCKGLDNDLVPGDGILLLATHCSTNAV